MFSNIIITTKKCTCYNLSLVKAQRYQAETGFPSRLTARSSLRLLQSHYRQHLHFTPVSQRRQHPQHPEFHDSKLWRVHISPAHFILLMGHITAYLCWVSELLPGRRQRAKQCITGLFPEARALLNMKLCLTQHFTWITSLASKLM